MTKKVLSDALFYFLTMTMSCCLVCKRVKPWKRRSW